jgi:hypothetical protein
MKNGTDQGFDQHYNVQAVVDQQSMLVVAATLSSHPNDQAEVAPTLDAIPSVLGTPHAAALDAGYFSAANITACVERGIEPYIAPGRDAHRQTLADLLAPVPIPPPETASPRVQMAYKLKTAKGKAIYRARKCTVEPVIGIIKEVMGFRQFSLRGVRAAAGEWCLVCLAYNLKRLHALLGGVLPSVARARAAQRSALAATDLLQAIGQAVVCLMDVLFAHLFHQARQADLARSSPPHFYRTNSFYSFISPTGC